MTATPSTAGPPLPEIRLVSRGSGTIDHAWQCFLLLAQPYPERRGTSVRGSYAPLMRLPQDARVRLAVENDDVALVVAEGEGYVTTIVASSQSTNIDVASRSASHADEILAAMSSSSADAVEGEVPVRMWRYGAHSAASWPRLIAAPTWQSIAQNYPLAVGADLEPLMRLTDVDGIGRVLVWSGEPGTGKTSAIRALLRAWQPWCRAHLVADPEKFFGDAAYLIEVMSSPTVHISRPRLAHEGQRSRRWNLVVCEDADDFISKAARRRTGSGLGRLLNLADGLLGQGLNTILLLTSNTRGDELDPALLRPGRCLANIQFSRFAAAEARAWLLNPRATVPVGGLTLAELYERRGDLARYGHQETEGIEIGAYL